VVDRNVNIIIVANSRWEWRLNVLFTMNGMHAKNNTHVL